jgi:hypothetical protein
VHDLFFWTSACAPELKSSANFKYGPNQGTAGGSLVPKHYPSRLLDVSMKAIYRIGACARRLHDPRHAPFVHAKEVQCSVGLCS